MIKKFNDFVNESLIDKMTPKSYIEVENNLNVMWDDFLNMFKKNYKKYWEDVYYFLGFKQQDIEELFIEGWSIDEVYDEYKYQVENYLDDLEYDLENNEI